MNYSDIEKYAKTLSNTLPNDTAEFYLQVAELNTKRARILLQSGALIVLFSVLMFFFLRWALLEGLIEFRLISGTVPQLAILALPFTCLGTYVFTSARSLLSEAKDEVEVMKKTVDRQEDELERLERLQTS